MRMQDSYRSIPVSGVHSNGREGGAETKSGAGGRAETFAADRNHAMAPALTVLINSVEVFKKPAFTPRLIHLSKNTAYSLYTSSIPLSIFNRYGLGVLWQTKRGRPASYLNS